jgi:hypothetical protein
LRLRHAVCRPFQGNAFNSTAVALSSINALPEHFVAFSYARATWSIPGRNLPQGCWCTLTINKLAHRCGTRIAPAFLTISNSGIVPAAKVRNPCEAVVEGSTSELLLWVEAVARFPDNEGIASREENHRRCETCAFPRRSGCPCRQAPPQSKLATPLTELRSASSSMLTICSSVNRLFFMTSFSGGSHSLEFWLVRNSRGRSPAREHTTKRGQF